jgi:hypothetical protein
MLLISYIKIFDLFNIKLVLYASVKFKLFLMIFFLFFMFVNLESYFIFVIYSIYIVIAFNFYYEKNKFNFVIKIFFLITVWYFFDCLLERDYNLHWIFTLFLYNYSNEFSEGMIKNKILDDLINKIKGFKLFEHSILDKKPDGDPDPNLTLTLLGIEETDSNKISDYTMKNLLYPETDYYDVDYLKNKNLQFFFPSIYAANMDAKVEEILKEDNKAIYDQDVNYKGKIYKLSEIKEFIITQQKSSEPFICISSEGLIYDISKTFPDIFHYINCNSIRWDQEQLSIKDILPRKFLIKNYSHLYLLNIQFNTLLLVKQAFENNIDNDEILLKLKNWWIKRQIAFFSTLDVELFGLKWSYKPLINPFSIEFLEKECKENILYTGSRILQYVWTINYINQNYTTNDLINIKEDKDAINFYNLIYSKFKEEVYCKEKKMFDLYQKIKEKRANIYGYGDRYLNHISLSEETYDKSFETLYNENKNFQEKLDKKLKNKIKYKNLKYQYKVKSKLYKLKPKIIKSKQVKLIKKN